MRVKRVAGLSLIWLGTGMLVSGASGTDLAVSFDFLASVLGGVLVLISGIWLAVMGEPLPEDTGETLVPRQWVWYALIAFSTVAAITFTAEILGIISA